jgi:hypothetical protein
MARATHPSTIEQLADLLHRRYTEPESSDRVVVLLGAGASIESGCRTWATESLRDSLMRAVIPAFGNERAFVAEARQRLAPYLRFPPAVSTAALRRFLVAEARTDQLCSVASLLLQGKQALIKFLKEEYSPEPGNPQPQLAYELIAHLIKHRFVDHVISLNFDEILDHALDDELGRDGYCRVLPGSSTDRDPALPRLFKLHGTISDEYSLRFSIEDTGSLTPDLAREITRVVFPRALEQRVWIVSLGYSWEDADMRAWIAGHYPAIAGIICVALNDEPARRLTEELARRRRRSRTARGNGSAEERPERFRIFPLATREIVPSPPAASVDEVLWVAWKETKHRIAASERVPSAARHLVISHLFSRRCAFGAAPGEGRQWPAVYERHRKESRFEAEVFLTTGKTDGMVILSSLARDARVYRHWSRGRRPPIDGLGFLRRSDFADVTEVFFFEGTPGEYASFFERRRGTRLRWSGEQIPDLTGRTIDVPRLERGKIVREPKRYYDFLEHYLGRVYEGTSVEVDPGTDPRASLLFRDFRDLRTYKELNRETDTLLRSDWTTLLVIAESGRWFRDHRATLEEDNGRTVLLIEASTFALEGWTSKPRFAFPEVGPLTIGIPWWLHNRHLTLAIRGDRLVGGVYFRRRERTPRISPSALGPGRDCRELLKIFVAYTARYFEEWSAWCDHTRNAFYETQSPAFYEHLKELRLNRLLPLHGRRWERRLDTAWESYLTQRDAVETRR